MGLTKYKFGDLIELSFVRNSDGKYGPDDTVGINIDKEIRKMKGDSSRKELKTFYLVQPDDFVYNPRGSRKLGLGYNNTSNTYITTFNNMIFRIREDAKGKILPYYLFLYLSRKEWDRFAEFLSWGSSTEVFSWDTFCDIDISLPDVEIQQKYVDIYCGLLSNQQSYEESLDDLRLTCDGYIQELKRNLQHKSIGPFISISNNKNDNLIYGIEDVRGISIEKKFIFTKADMTGVSLKPYSIVGPNQFAYVTVTSRNGGKISIAHNKSTDSYICSSSYVVFYVSKPNLLLPEYLMMFLSQPEFDRYARFNSWGSTRETFDWDEMCNVRIPIPDVSVQQSIVNIYNAYLLRKDINERLKAQIRDICPILIKGSLEEGA